MTNDNATSKNLLKFEELMKPLGKSSETVNEHLSKHLSEYVQCFEELTADGEFGLAALTYEQSAMMIGNLSNIWKVLEFVRMNRKSSTSKKNIEDPENTEDVEDTEDTEDTEEQGKRVRKSMVYEDFSEIVPNVIDPDIKSDDENEPVKPLPIRRHVMTTIGCKLRKRSYQIFDVEGNALDPADYSIMSQTSSVGKLQPDVLKEVVNEINEHRSQESVTSPMSIKRSSSSDNDTLMPVKQSMSETDSDADMELDRVCRVGHSVREREMRVNVNDTWEIAGIDETMPDRPLRKGTSHLESDISLIGNERKREPKTFRESWEINKGNIGKYIPGFEEFHEDILRLENKKGMKVTEDLTQYNSDEEARNLSLVLSRECEKDFFGYDDYEPEPGKE